MKAINIITLVLVIVGGINWGLVGAADMNLVETLLGADTMPTKVVYILVGLSALWQLIPLFKSFGTSERAAQAS